MGAAGEVVTRLSVVLLLCMGCQPDSSRTADRTIPPNPSRASADSVFLFIDYTADRADTLRMVVPTPDSLTVLDVLRILTARDSIYLKTQAYAIGVLIEQIGDRKNGEGGFWLYTVNSEAIPRAASACAANAGDTIRFFFDER